MHKLMNLWTEFLKPTLQFSEIQFKAKLKNIGLKIFIFILISTVSTLETRLGYVALYTIKDNLQEAYKNQKYWPSTVIVHSNQRRAQ